MFRTNILKGVAPFALFIKRFGNSAELEGLKIANRGRTLGKWYRALSRVELAKLKAEAAKTTFPKKRVVPKQPRKPSAYNLFVKRNWNTVRGKAPERLSKLAAAWVKKQKK
jgi:hypothetical protein